MPAVNPLRVAPVAVALILALAGCGPEKSEPVTEPTSPAHPGAYCRQAGQRATTDTGTPVVCSTTASDDRLRWRSGN